MEPVSLTLGAVAARLIARVGDRTLDATLTEGETALRRLLEGVRARFSRQGDEGALDTLELVEKAPDSHKQIAELAKAIDRHALDERFQNELQELIGQVERNGVNVSQVSIGANHIQIADVGDSAININK